MRVVAIIAAKGHSSRLQNKNKRKLFGKPLFRHAADAACASGVFAKVIVSTDDPDIVKECRVNTLLNSDLRPPAVRGDQFSAPQVAAELVERIGGGSAFDAVCLINCCCPLTQPFHFKEALASFDNSDAVSLCSVVRSKSNPHYHYRIEKGELLWPWAETRVQSNTFETYYFGNGAFGMIRTKALIQKGTLFLAPCIPYIMAVPYSFDIDTEEDFLETQAQMKRLAVSDELYNAKELITCKQ